MACGAHPGWFTIQKLQRSRSLLLSRTREGLRGWSEDKGTEVVEVALVLPLYFMLVFGMTSFAMLLFAYCNATFAAKTAARYAALHSSNSLAPYTQTAINSIVTPFLWGAPSCTGCVVISVSPQIPPSAIGTPVTVTVSLTYSTGLPYTNLTGLVAKASGEAVTLR